MIKKILITILFLSFISTGVVQAARDDGVWGSYFDGTSIYTKPFGSLGHEVLIYGLNKYLNFNSTVGSSGYGFRDNAGTMEFKNFEGSWTGIGSGGGGGGLTIGTTTITSGATTNVLYNNAGVLGEYTISGSGTILAMATGSTLTSPTITTSIIPTTDDGAPLGDVTHNFSDLFLASGGVINWNNGNVVITHSTGALTITGGTLSAPQFSPTGTTATGNRLYLPTTNTLGFSTNGTGRVQINTTALSPITNDGFALGSTTLQWSDIFLASGGVINFSNGNWVATHTSGILTVGTGDLRITTAGTNTASAVTVGGTQTLTAKTLTSAKITTLLQPTTHNGAELGTVGLGFSSLSLATGGGIYWTTSGGDNYANIEYISEGVLQTDSRFIVSGGVTFPNIAISAPTANYLTIGSEDLSAGNTMLSIYGEGTSVGSGTPTANRTIAIKVNGVIYYVLASTTP